MKDCRKIEWLIADHIKTKIQTIMACDNIIGISVSTFWMLNGRRVILHGYHCIIRNFPAN